MPDNKLKKLHSVIQSQGMTDKSLEDFTSEYSSSDKQSHLYDVLKGEGMTDKSLEDFTSEYFTQLSQTPEEPKKANAEETMESESPSADLASSSDSKQAEDTKFQLDGRAKYPELMTERDSIVKEMESLSVMETSGLQTRLDEIDSIVNSKPKSYRTISQERLGKIDKLIQEKEQEDYKRGDEVGVLENDPTYKALMNERKIVDSEIKNQDEIIRKITNDEGFGESILKRISSGLYTPETEQLDLSKDIEEKLLLKLDSDDRLRESYEYGGDNHTTPTVKQRESLIRKAKTEVFSEKIVELTDSKNQLIKSLNETDSEKEKFQIEKELETLQDTANQLFIETGYDVVNNKFKDSFTKTTEGKELDESLSDSKGLDTLSTFTEGLIDVTVDGMLSGAGLLGSVGSFFSDDDEYGVFDALSNVVEGLGDINISPSSNQQSGRLIPEGGDWKDIPSNLSLYNTGKTLANMLPFTLSLALDARNGNVKGAHSKLAKFLNPKNAQSLEKTLRVGTGAYRKTLVDNMREAEELGLTGTNKAVLANGMAVTEGLFSMVMPEHKFLSSTKRELLKKGFAETLKASTGKEISKKLAKDFIGNNLKELAEEELTMISQELMKLSLVDNYKSTITNMNSHAELVVGTLLMGSTMGSVGLKGKIGQAKTDAYNQLNENYEKLTSDIQEMSSNTTNPELKKALENSLKQAASIKDAMNKSPKNVTGEQIDLIIEKKEIVEEMKTMDEAYHPEYKQKIETINENIRKAASLKETESGENNKSSKEETKQRENKTTGKKKGLLGNPNPETATLSKKYKERNGIQESPEFIPELDREKSKEIADAYEDMKHDPHNPEVKEAYTAMVDETIEQYNDIIEAGYEVEMFEGEGEPYANSQEMMDDLRENNHLYIFGTETGFGDTAITEEQRNENPLLGKTEFTDKNGKPMLTNDVFRFVHDFFGHSEKGNGFGVRGEEIAWDSHARMYSDKARRAMTTETRGQNSWVNSGKHVRNEDGSIKKKGDDGYLSAREKPFAEQKIGLLDSKYSEVLDTNGGSKNDSDINQIEKIDLSNKLGVDKAYELLDTLDKQLTKYGQNRTSVGLPIAVAQGTIKAMKVAVGVSKTGLDITSAGLNYIQDTDWYKGLSKDAKSEFHKKGLLTSLNDVEQELRKVDKSVKDPSVKKTIRDNTGQTDLSRKRLISEAKLLKEQLKNLSKGSKLGAKHIERFKNDFVQQLRTLAKGMGKDMTNSEVDQLLNKARKVNEKNINSVVNETKRLLERVETRVEKKKYNSTLKGIVKRAVKFQKKKGGHQFHNILPLSHINVEAIPETMLDEYYNVMEKASKGKVSPQEINNLYSELKEDIVKDVEERYNTKLNAEPKAEKDTSEQLGKVKELLKDKIDLSSLPEADALIVKKLLGMDTKLIETLNVKKLNQIITNLETLKEHGYIENKKLNSIVTFLNATETANEMKAEIGDSVLHVSNGIKQEVKRLKGKEQTQKIDEIEARFQNKMLHLVDTLIKGSKGTLFYDNIVHPITSGLQKASEMTTKTHDKLDVLVKAAKINTPFDFNVKLQLLARQLEYQSNLTFKGKSTVINIGEHIKATLDLHKKGKSQYSDESIKIISDLYDSFKTESGEVNSEAILESLSTEERAIWDFMRSNLNKSKKNRQDSDSNLIGESSTILEEFFPRTYDKGEKGKKGIKDYIKNAATKVSTKPNSAKERNVNKSMALDFDTMGSFLNHMNTSNVEVTVGQPLKEVTITLSQLEGDNASLNRVAAGLTQSINTLMDVHLSGGVYGKQTQSQRILKTLMSKTFNKILISTTRLVGDFASQNITLATFHAGDIKEIRKISKEMGDVGDMLKSDYSSTQGDRIAGSRSIDFQEGISSRLSQKKWSEADPSKTDKLVDLLGNNKLSALGDMAAKRYYEVIDFTANHMWKFHFANNFKSITGENFNTNEYKTNPDYKVKFDKAIKKTMARADKQLSNIYNTGAQAEQKIKAQIGSKNKNFLSAIDSFMQSFSFNENGVWWDSLMSMMGKEGGTITDKKEAFKTFAIVNTRSLMYAYLAQTTIDTFMRLTGLIGGDDEDLYERAAVRSAAQHGMLVAFGNKGAVMNSAISYIFENIIHKTIVESNGGKYDPYVDSVLFSHKERGRSKDVIGSLGAQGAFIKTAIDFAELGGNLIQSYNKEGEVSYDNIVKYKTYQILMSTLAQGTGLPLDKFGKQIQKIESYELKKRKSLQKKLDKTVKKKKKSKYSF